MGRAAEARSASASGERSTRRASYFEVFAIKANGFSLRNFRSRRVCTAARIPRVAGQVVSADSFDREDCAGIEKFGGFGNARVVAGDRLRSGLQRIMRSAIRAGDRLRVKTAVGRLAVLPAQ